jgi:hypothetical protein
LVVCAIVIMVSWCLSGLAFAESLPLSRDRPTEFSARLVWTTSGRVANALLFVKKGRYRIELSEGDSNGVGLCGCHHYPVG